MNSADQGLVTRRRILQGAATVASFAAVGSARAQALYQGKQITIVVGSGAGGGYDACARLLARFWPKYIPGNPVVVVRNMPGAGSLNAMNFIANVAPKDGLTVGAPQNTIGYEPLMGLSGSKENAHFDPTKLPWLGSMSKEVSVPILWNPAPVKSLQELIDTKRVVTTGSTGISTPNSIYANLMNSLLGTRFEVIQGYASQTALFLAMERGEVQGSGGPFYSSLITSKPSWIRDKQVTVLVQIALERHPALPDVPLIFDFVKKEEDIQQVKLATAALSMGRPFVLPNGVPDEQVAILRTAFMAAMRDPELIEEGRKMGIEIDAIDGAALGNLLGDMYRSPAQIVEKVAAIFLPERK
jgi:tripartite-type tricarboxylate transporter receptor subunit TctC